MYNYFKALNTDIVVNVLYIYIYFILFYIMYYIHIVKRFRAHCGFYAIENKLLLLLLFPSFVLFARLCPFDLSVVSLPIIFFIFFHQFWVPDSCIASMRVW